MDDHINIQTSNHHCKLFMELHNLQRQGIACDVTVAATDGEISAHRIILISASKYFRQKLMSDLRETNSRVYLQGVYIAELANIIKYIYSGKLFIARDSIDMTLKVCELLELGDVLKGYKDTLIQKRLKGKKVEQVREDEIDAGSTLSTVAADKRDKKNEHKETAVVLQNSIIDLSEDNIITAIKTEEEICLIDLSMEDEIVAAKPEPDENVSENNKSSCEIVKLEPDETETCFIDLSMEDEIVPVKSEPDEYIGENNKSSSETVKSEPDEIDSGSFGENSKTSSPTQDQLSSKQTINNSNINKNTKVQTTLSDSLKKNRTDSEAVATKQSVTHKRVTQNGDETRLHIPFPREKQISLSCQGRPQIGADTLIINSKSHIPSSSKQTYSSLRKHLTENGKSHINLSDVVTGGFGTLLNPYQLSSNQKSSPMFSKVEDTNIKTPVLASILGKSISQTEFDTVPQEYAHYGNPSSSLNDKNRVQIQNVPSKLKKPILACGRATIRTPRVTKASDSFLGSPVIKVSSSTPQAVFPTNVFKNISDIRGAIKIGPMRSELPPVAVSEVDTSKHSSVVSQKKEASLSDEQMGGILKSTSQLKEVAQEDLSKQMQKHSMCNSGQQVQNTQTNVSDSVNRGSIDLISSQSYHISTSDQSSSQAKVDSSQSLSIGGDTEVVDSMVENTNSETNYTAEEIRGKTTEPDKVLCKSQELPEVCTLSSSKSFQIDYGEDNVLAENEIKIELLDEMDTIENEDVRDKGNSISGSQLIVNLKELSKREFLWSEKEYIEPPFTKHDLSVDIVPAHKKESHILSPPKVRKKTRKTTSSMSSPVKFKQQYKRHLKLKTNQKHPLHSSKESGPFKRQKRYRCDICHCIIGSKAMYNLHMNNIHEAGQAYQCSSEGCSYSSPCKWKLNAHRKIKHGSIKHSSLYNIRGKSAKERFDIEDNMRKGTVSDRRKGQTTSKRCGNTDLNGHVANSNVRVTEAVSARDNRYKDSDWSESMQTVVCAAVDINSGCVGDKERVIGSMDTSYFIKREHEDEVMTDIVDNQLMQGLEGKCSSARAVPTVIGLQCRSSLVGLSPLNRGRGRPKKSSLDGKMPANCEEHNEAPYARRLAPGLYIVPNMQRLIGNYYVSFDSQDYTS